MTMGRMDVLAEEVNGIGLVCTEGSFYQPQGLKLGMGISRGQRTLLVAGPSSSPRPARMSSSAASAEFASPFPGLL